VINTNINDKFGELAESFARFFGTPKFIIGQTIFVFIWILINVLSPFNFDPYPFILLNLAFSTQAAYAAPLILLAQSRQSDRDKIWSEQDARHRQEMAQTTLARQKAAANIDKKIVKLMEEQARQNELILQLSRRIEPLISEIHLHLLNHNSISAKEE
jgi:uncharacterized membrane protein